MSRTHDAVCCVNQRRNARAELSSYPGAVKMKPIAALQALLAASQTKDPMLPPGELRFVLEYPGTLDLAVERVALESYLRSRDFILQPLFPDNDPDLAKFVVLRFPTVGRGLDRDQVFAVAYALVRERKLTSAEPDLGSDLFADPVPPGVDGHPEGAELLGPLCWVDAQPPADHWWALRAAGIPRAWSKSRGRGILVGQPDTGVARHAELDASSLRLDLAADILDGDPDPTDPLDSEAANPGHGTAVASVVVSGEGGRIAGAAPGAGLVPIRCISDVKVFDGAPVAAAVRHATRVGCHVITMSLGGLPSRALHAAIRDAIAKDVIVLAAAGNCVPFVVYPARYPDVIAVGGTNIDRQPWKGSSRGSSVDVSAPAELVWRAERRSPIDPIDGIGGGQGTSFAVALTAGAAALWLSHHGVESVLAAARSRGVTVQRLFAAALTATAARPDGWDCENMGAGIIDAGALLDLELERIPATGVESAADPDHIGALLDEAAPAVESAGVLDRSVFGLEAAALAFDRAREQRLSPGARAESPVRRAQASSELMAAATAAADGKVVALALYPRLERSREPLPPAAATPAVPTTVAIVGVARGGGLESHTALSPEAVHAALNGVDVGKRVEQLEKRVADIEREEGTTDPTIHRLRRDAISAVPTLLERFRKNGPDATFDSTERVSMEALVRLTDRPAVRVKEGRIDPDDPRLEGWRGTVSALRPAFPPILKAVGRIDMMGRHVGTGFVVAPGIVMTNRHVVEAFATPAPARRNPKRWLLSPDVVTINFSDTGDAVDGQFRITEVIFAGPDPIGAEVKASNLDMALLAVDSNNGKEALPAPIPLVDDPARLRAGGTLFVAGFPARPEDVPLDAAGKVRRDVEDRLWALFGTAYGVKYFCPGEASTSAGARDDDALRWLFTHDASTLRGNSGSCVVHLGDPVAVVGLHVAGDWLRANFAQSLAAVYATGRLPMQHAARMTWMSRS
ncbi:S8 family serine peptidase [Methylorubrum thiocyanatum]|uniref:S8 family serine peptidase n=1 Tax=Methylorubrum thiocyanatum TaxID=47958 RepID=UPI00365A853F